MTLSVLKPITIVDASFTSSTIPETDYTAYSAVTTYAVGDRAISTTTHRIYESLVAGNINHDPTLIANRVINSAGVTYWLDYGPTNKWAMLDSIVSTQSTVATPLTVVLHPGFFNAVYFGGLYGDTILVVVKDAPGGNTIYNNGTVTLEASQPIDYYEYFFDPFSPKTNYLIEGIAPYLDAQITVTIAAATGSVKCGIMAVGDLRPLGRTLEGAKAKPKTYAYIDINKYGENTIIPGKQATDFTCTATLDITEATTVLGVVQALLATPCVWVIEDCTNYEGLIGFGLGSGELNYANNVKSELSLNVQGLI